MYPVQLKQRVLLGVGDGTVGVRVGVGETGVVVGEFVSVAVLVGVFVFVGVLDGVSVFVGVFEGVKVSLGVSV